MDVITPLGSVHTQSHGSCLAEKFWVWESLEEAVRADIDTMPYEQVHLVMQAFSTHLKGSEDLFDVCETRVYREE